MLIKVLSFPNEKVMTYHNNEITAKYHKVSYIKSNKSKINFDQDSIVAIGISINQFIDYLNLNYKTSSKLKGDPFSKYNFEISFKSNLPDTLKLGEINKFLKNEALVF